MLKASDLAQYNLSALSAGLIAIAARRGLAALDGKRLLAEADADAAAHNAILLAEGAIPLTDAGLPDARRIVDRMDADSALCAEAAGFIDLVRAFLADENQRRPPAPVLRLAPRPAPLEPAPKPSLYERTLAALGRAPAKPGKVDAA